MKSAPRFAAVLSPAGLDLARYEEGSEGLELVRHVHEQADFTGIERAADALADRIEAEGGRGGGVTVVLRGFGSAHHLLRLPPADDHVLRSVVRRELRRLHADIEDPVLDFVRLADRSGESGELLAAAAPRAVVERIHDTLGARGISLEHLTVGSAALRRLHEAFGGTESAEVMLLLLPGGPLVAGFHEGRLRFSHEPPIRPGSGAEGAAVAELVRRAFFALRGGPFRSTAESRLLVSGEPAARDRLDAHLETPDGRPAEPLGPADAAPGALAALGGALDAVGADRLDLRPEHARRPSAAGRRRRRVGTAVAAALAAASLVWAGAQVLAAESAREALEPVRERIEARADESERMAATVRERAAHAERIRFLEGTAGRRMREILEGVAAAAPGGVRVERLDVRRAPDGSWTVSVDGVARGGSEAEALLAVQRVHDDLQLVLPVEELRLASLDPSGSDASAAGPAAVDFRLNLGVRWGD